MSTAPTPVAQSEPATARAAGAGPDASEAGRDALVSDLAALAIAGVVGAGVPPPVLPPKAPPASVALLQRTVGNQAVSHMMQNRPPAQRWVDGPPQQDVLDANKLPDGFDSKSDPE